MLDISKHTDPASCPFCGGLMTYDLIVCWSCAKETDKVYAIHPSTVKKWSDARDARIKAAEQNAPVSPLRP